MKIKHDSWDRVRAHTPAYVNDRIDRMTEGWLAHYAELDGEAIRRRLEELDREWDLDRAVMANFAALGGTSFLLGASKNRAWWGLFGTQMFFLAVHAIKGWCPPAAVFRRMMFRTRQEIEAEKRALREVLSSREQPSVDGVEITRAA